MTVVEIKKAKRIVKEETGREPIFLEGKSHEEQMACKMACCWGGYIKAEGLEIKCCQPSPSHKGSKPGAYFTFKKI